jgi:hypothetical protein
MFASREITVTINPINDAPVLQHIKDITIEEGDTAILVAIAIDADNDTLFYTYNGKMTSSTWKTTHNDSGTHTVMVTVSDGLLADSQNVTITVKDMQFEVVTVTRPSATPRVNEGITINAPLKGAAKATLYYTTDQGITVNNVEMVDNDKDGVYTAILPGQKAGTNVKYYIEIEDKYGDTLRSPSDKNVNYEVIVGEKASGGGSAASGDNSGLMLVIGIFAGTCIIGAIVWMAISKRRIV